MFFDQLWKWLAGPRRRALPPPAVLAVMSDVGCLPAAARNLGLTFAVAPSCQRAIQTLEDVKFSIIVCDRDLPGFDWHETMEMFTTIAPGSCVILASAVNDEYLWREVIQRGGYDVLKKPLQLEQATHSLGQAALYYKASAVCR